MASPEQLNDSERSIETPKVSEEQQATLES